MEMSSAYYSGKNAGLDDNYNNPFVIGSVEYSDYNRGYQDGRDEVGDEYRDLEDFREDSYHEYVEY